MFQGARVVIRRRQQRGISEAEEEAKKLLEFEFVLEQLVEVEVKVVSGGEGDGWW